MTSTQGTAVVGTGFIGPVHVEALRRLGRPVVGILGSGSEKSARAAERLRLAAYNSFDDLLEDQQVSTVHLTSPNRYHYSQCKEAIAAGKHVICEKPLAMSSKESQELVALARETDRITAVCYNVRFYPLCIEARHQISAGNLGKIYHIMGSYVQDWLLYETDFSWRIMAEEGGPLRAMADIGSHWMDLLTTITGLEIESVCADLLTVHPIRQRPIGSVETFSGKYAPDQTEPVPVETEDYGSVLLRFRGGARGSFSVSQVTSGRKNCIRFEIAGEKGSLAWNSEQPNELWMGHREEANRLLIRDPGLMSEGAEAFSDYPGGHNEGFPDTFKQLFRSIYSAIDGNDRSLCPYPTFEDGHREVVYCEAILRSHMREEWVSIPPIS